MGCATLPQTGEFRDTVAAYPGGNLPPEQDGRVRFRQIYCALATPTLTRAGEPLRCDDVLWRLRDEPVAGPADGLLPSLVRDLRILVVGGAFSDCREPGTIAFEEAIERFASQGVRIRSVRISGRSGTEFNARRIAAAVEGDDARPGDRIVLVGYSKGTPDILQFLVDYPQLGRQVVAVVSVAGAVGGSPLAHSGNWWYRTFFDESFAALCDPGDGQVVQSLVPAVRQRWLQDHPLPPHVRYYSIAAFTTSEHLSHGLAVTWQMLARHDRRNDGQLLVGDAVIPGSVLLGYVNADHWDVALALDRQMPYLSARKVARTLPRTELLEAALLYAGEDLQRAGLSEPVGRHP